MIAYVGSYTTPELNGQGEGISVYHVNPDSGEWTRIQVAKEAVDPSFVVLDDQDRYLYCVYEGQEQTSAFSIDAESGKLTFLNTQSTGGSTPASLGLDPTNRFLIVGNYFGGTVALFPVKQDGSLEPIRQLIQTQNESGSDPENYSHPHDIRFDPAGRYLFIPLKGYDKILSYELLADEKKLVANDPASVTVESGAGPRHIVFHPNQAFAYVVNELNSTVIVFRYAAEQGALQELQTISTLPSDFTGDNTGAEISVAPSGKFVYASNRGHNSIVVFEVEHTTGELSPIQWVSTEGKNPRFFTLDPEGRILYAANQNSHTIVAFEVDQTSGKLTPTGQVIEVGSPVCIAFAHK